MIQFTSITWGIINFSTGSYYLRDLSLWASAIEAGGEQDLRARISEGQGAGSVVTKAYRITGLVAQGPLYTMVSPLARVARIVCWFFLVLFMSHPRTNGLERKAQTELQCTTSMKLTLRSSILDCGSYMN